jgi:hypothetical protein
MKRHPSRPGLTRRDVFDILLVPAIAIIVALVIVYLLNLQGSPP